MVSQTRSRSARTSDPYNHVPLEAIARLQQHALKRETGFFVTQDEDEYYLDIERNVTAC